uniref:Antitoxin n=1 Tax=Candidatus Kentrum sp. LPFa TaxID=2126335 RepID=A0A450W4A1_9GAMM|nr:MAG: hypothetical protein BECKLPF1236B_GA0070989_102615 [Candidatus Kentron sp. LPFa]VFK21992.1 MAG: hypothetical protein BECKLPF1236A_GA0070988_103283 [Candidatus Kentron sp. LPFa]VFK35002.1 MAG: hypothetical protein BECKLPF1236C_GA0070990_103213 [Candidatus Kentron sp. LPFa]
MREYGLTEAQQYFASILDQAKREGIVCIKKRESEYFYVTSAEPKRSPLDIEGADLGMTSSEIVEVIRENREREYSR